MAESNNQDWRKLCAAAAEETDSEKLISLVNQILQAFEERDRGGKHYRTQNQFCGDASK